MNITKQEIINELSLRTINSKTNNLIINSFNSEEIVKEIPEICGISFSGYNLDNEIAFNIKVDMKKVYVRNILTYVMALMRDRKLFDPIFTYNLPFNNKYEVVKFNNVLQNSARVIQIICYNMDNLSIENQKLFNELYYYTSPWFNVTSFVNDGFITYDLSGNCCLVENKNYQKYELIKDKILKK